jgi:ABC-type nitrate/sulfonate/bicarbonate transport system substrate-binding protein
MFRNLAAGTIDGYCAGEPWNTLAVREGAGWCPTWSAAQQPGQLEKVLMVTEHFAQKRPGEHAALVAALAEACAWCDEPQHREPLAQLLAEADYLNLAARVITPALTGRFECGNGHVESTPDFHVFHRGDANVPTAAKAAELQSALIGAGLLTATITALSALPPHLFREDLYRDALNTNQTHEAIS